MRIPALQVVHLKKKAMSLAASLPGLPRADLELDTCQRKVWVYEAPVKLPCFKDHPALEIQTGEQGYLLLLLIANGLKSEIQGETNIFGQIKTAWGDHLESFPWLQSLFADTKEIRAQYLGNQGRPTYGSLVRKLLKTSAHEVDAPVLLVGAGDMAASVAPWLADRNLWLLNRNPDRVSALEKDLVAKGATRVRILSAAEEAEAWARAGQAVVCIPFDREMDEKRIRMWVEGSKKAARPLLHLGGLRNEAAGWSEVPGFACLDDLFTLERKAGQVREIQISRAEKACWQRAKLRALGDSLSVAHGWEDLAAFA